MTNLGPNLPSQLLTKRKWLAVEEEKIEEEENEAISNAIPPSTDPCSSDLLSADVARKKSRVIGPSLPTLDDRPPDATIQEGSDSGSDFGPALPGNNQSQGYSSSSFDSCFNDFNDTSSSTKCEKNQMERDEWMKVPPKQDDLAARMDPTKIRPRKFNTSKGANKCDGDAAMWTETLEQKRIRVKDEVMGVSRQSTVTTSSKARASKKVADEETMRRINSITQKTRGESLYEQHKGRDNRPKGDDPSKRAFDREKDMASRVKIGHAQRNEIVNRASNFGSKFSGGGYL